MTFKILISIAVVPLTVGGVVSNIGIANAAGLVGSLSFNGDGVRIGADFFSFLESGSPVILAPFTVTGTGNSGSFTQFIGVNGGDNRGGFISAVGNTLGGINPLPGADASNLLLDLGDKDGLNTFHLNTILSPWLVQVGNSVAAAVGITGLFKSADGTLTKGVGVFTTAFTNTNIAQIKYAIETQGFVENSYAGTTFAVQAVPEPITMAGSALALGAIGYFKRKQSAKKAAGVA
jgi:hypothetical protein